MGRTIALTDPELRTRQMAYDSTGAQRWSETPDGRFTVQLLDGLGRATTTIVND